MVIFILLITILTFICILYTVAYFVGRWDDYINPIVLNFSTWLEMYKICPRKWDITWSWPSVTYHNGKNEYCINISFFTAWRFWLWRLTERKSRYKQSINKVEAEFFQCIQNDSGQRLKEETELQVQRMIVESILSGEKSKE